MSATAIQVKNQQKTITTEEKLDVISQLENGEWIVGTCWHIRLIHSTVHTICSNTDRMKLSAKCLDNTKWQQYETGTVWVARQPLY